MWNEIIEHLTTDNYWSIIKLKRVLFYKINYKTSQANRFITFEKVFNSIRSSILKNTNCKEKQTILRRNISSSNRAPLDIWKMYIEDLVLDNFLKIEETDNEIYYSLIE